MDFRREEITENCFCDTLNIAFIFGKIFGFFPLTKKHSGQVCEFKKSAFWFTYISILGLVISFSLFFLYDFKSLFQKNEYPVLLNDITDLVYGMYYAQLILYNLYRQTDWIYTLNSFNSIIRKGILCPSTLKLQKHFEIVFILCFSLLVVLYAVLLAYITNSNSFTYNPNFFSILGKFLQNFIFLFYLYLLTFFTVIISSFNCFHQMSINALNYRRKYPMKPILGTRNKQNLFNLFDFTCCKGAHVPKFDCMVMSTSEKIEYFRLLHEELSMLVIKINSCFNPQLLIHITVEISMLVINWYAVIIGFSYNFNTPETDALLVLNLVFAVFHTLGILSLLRNSQALTNTIEGYISFLIEYSTRVSSSSDLLQLRIFIEKIKQRTHFSANEMFIIDLSLSGPIFGTILTYVLVILQFDIS